MMEEAMRDMGKAIGCMMVLVPVLALTVIGLTVALVLKW